MFSTRNRTMSTIRVLSKGSESGTPSTAGCGTLLSTREATRKQQRGAAPSSAPWTNTATFSAESRAPAFCGNTSRFGSTVLGPRRDLHRRDLSGELSLDMKNAAAVGHHINLAGFIPAKRNDEIRCGEQQGLNAVLQHEDFAGTKIAEYVGAH